MFTLQRALEVIKDKPEFSVKERDCLTVIDYNVTMINTFVGLTRGETELLQNLRGTMFNDDGKIVRLAYHKFHNLGENEDYHSSKFNFSEPHVIQEKLDGSMVTPYPNFGRHNTGWEFGTRAGSTDVAQKAWNLMASWKGTSKFDAYKSFIDSMLAVEMTPIFEFCSREQRIVIDYPEPKLVLTDVRSNATGEYVSYHSIVEGLKFFTNGHLIDVVKQIASEYSTPTELAEVVRQYKGAEGVVVKFESGKYVKIKAEEYCLQHRALDGLRFEKDVLKMILTNTIDDVLPLLGEDVKKRVTDYQESVLHRIQLAQNEMEEMFAKLKHLDRKSFAELVLSSPYKSGLFAMYSNKIFTIRDFVLSKCTSSTNVEEVRWIIGKSYLEFV